MKKAPSVVGIVGAGTVVSALVGLLESPETFRAIAERTDPLVAALLGLTLAILAFMWRELRSLPCKTGEPCPVETVAPSVPAPGRKTREAPGGASAAGRPVGGLSALLVALVVGASGCGAITAQERATVMQAGASLADCLEGKTDAATGVLVASAIAGGWTVSATEGRAIGLSTLFAILPCLSRFGIVAIDQRIRASAKPYYGSAGGELGGADTAPPQIERIRILQRNP